MTSRWIRRRDVIWRRTADAVLVLPLDADEPFALAGSGPMVWDLLERPLAPDDIAPRLARSTGANVQVIADQLATLLADLARRGAVEAVP